MNETKKNIFIPEDDSGITLVLNEILAKEFGYQLENFSNEADMLKALLAVAKKPQLLLCDLVLKEGEVNLKQFVDTGIPVILLTARTNGVEIAQQSGAAGFLSKPFSIIDLVRAVRNCIG
jgi:DNA-binding NtrC family response regulator